MAPKQPQEATPAHNDPEAAETVCPVAPDALRVDQAASRLNVSERTIRRLVKNGELRAIRLIRTLLIPTSEIDRVLEFRGVNEASKKGGKA